MKLLLIRHGETTENVSRTIGSRLPGPPLCDVGAAQARELSATLAGEAVPAVHSSLAVRAVETGSILAAALDVPHTAVTGLHEIDAGDLEGHPYAESLGGYAGTMQKWWTDRDARIPGGESGSEFMARYDAAIAMLEAEAVAAGVDTMAIVSHEAAICVWASSSAGNLDEAFSRGHGVRNTGVVVLEGSTAEGWRATSWDGEVLPR